MTTLRELVERVREARPCDADCMGHPERVCADWLCHRCRARLDLADHLLAHPKAVEAVEVLRRLGEARKATGAFAVGDECRARWAAEDAVNKLADRLAGGG